VGERLHGTLTDFTVRGRNGWGTGTLHSDDGDVPIVGQLPGAKVGDSVSLTGLHVKHPLYGPQFKVTGIELSTPVSRKAIIAWLDALPHIGLKRAEAIVDRFGERLWDILDNEPEALLTVDGITGERLASICEAYHAAAAERDADLTLRTLGFGPGLLAKLATFHGDLVQALAAIRDNPYSLQRDVHGIGFRISDRVAGELGIYGSDPRRIAGALRFVMEEAASKGHCYGQLDIILARVGEAAGETRAAVEAALRIDDAKWQGIEIVEGRVWLRNTLRDERECAQAVRALVYGGRPSNETQQDETDLGW